MRQKANKAGLVVLAIAAAVLVPALWRGTSKVEALTAIEATISSPIILDSTGNFLAVVNPDNDTVAIDPVNLPYGSKLHEYPVGREPRSLALLGLEKLYVSNAVDGTVSVLDFTNGSLKKTIGVGAEPWNIALTPNGKKLYVSNFGSNSVSVIDTTTDTLTKTIHRVGSQPSFLVIPSVGEKVFVGWWLAQYRPGDVRPGEDDGKVGMLSVISTATDEVVDTIPLNPLADTGFKSDGSSIDKIAPTGTATIVTGAFPNILAGAAFKNGRLYIPATGSSPNGPVKFNVNVQSLVVEVDPITDADLGKTVNLNKGIQFEAEATDSQGRPLKRFVTNPYGIVFRHNSNSGYVVSAASDMLVKVDLLADGTPTINAPPAQGQPGNVKRILVGKNPRAFVINPTDSLGYAWNYVSRSVTVVNLTTDATLGEFITSLQPANPTLVTAQRGKELFNTSIGPLFGTPPQGAMSDHGWVSCASCHPNGLTDGVTWQFASGPRVSTPLNSTFDPNGINQRALNFSAIFDEVADFELNTRGVAGGHGIITLPDNNPDPNVKAFDPPSAGRNADRDAITTYVKVGIRTLSAGIPANDIRAGEGRKIFRAAGCASCHGGSNWTSSRLEFAPPPPASALATEQGTAQLVGQLRQVGTFDATKKWEVIGTGANISKQALGQLGFNPPSLRGLLFAKPYLHDGSAETLEDVLENKNHVGHSPLLDVPGKRVQLIRFLQSIDDATPAFNPSERPEDDLEVER